MNGLNGTTSTPKSVPCLVLDKVRLVPQVLSKTSIWEHVFIEWMLPLWIPFETNIHCYFSIKYYETGDMHVMVEPCSSLVVGKIGIKNCNSMRQVHNL